MNCVLYTVSFLDCVILGIGLKIAIVDFVCDFLTNRWIVCILYIDFFICIFDDEFWSV